jgi:hypothetical protein
MCTIFELKIAYVMSESHDIVAGQSRLVHP